MASQTITGLGLQFTQDNKRCFAYSGLWTASQTPSTELLFTTASGTIVAQLQLNMPVDDDNPAQAVIAAADIKFNEITVAIISGSSTDAGSNRSVRQKLIIPPFTTVTITVDSAGNEADRYGSLVLTGRVYEHLPVRN